MNPIHAITDRLGNRGTLVAAFILLILLFAALDYHHLAAPSPKVTLLADAWQDYDRAALSRDAAGPAFDHAFTPLTRHLDALQTLTNRAPAFGLDQARRASNQAAEDAFHNGLNALRECRAWLQTYRQSPDPSATRDNARDHIDACTEAYPLTTNSPARGLNDPDPVTR